MSKRFFYAEIGCDRLGILDVNSGNYNNGGDINDSLGITSVCYTNVLILLNLAPIFEAGFEER